MIEKTAGIFDGFVEFFYRRKEFQQKLIADIFRGLIFPGNESSEERFKELSSLRGVLQNVLRTLYLKRSPQGGFRLDVLKWGGAGDKEQAKSEMTVRGVIEKLATNSSSANETVYLLSKFSDELDDMIFHFFEQPYLDE